MATVLPSDTVMLARQVRERFSDEAAKLLNVLPGQISTALETPGAKHRATSEVINAAATFHLQSGAWLKAAQHKWHHKVQACLVGKTNLGSPGTESSHWAGLALVDNDEMDRTVAVGRLTLAILDKVGPQLSDLRARMQRLEGSADAASDGIFRPELFSQVLLDAWADCGLTSSQWVLVQDAMHKYTAQGLSDIYAHANVFLSDHGVTADVDLRTKVRRAPDRVTALGRPSGFGDAPRVPGTLSGDLYPTRTSGGYELPSPGLETVASGVGGFVYVPPGNVARSQYEAMLYSSGSGILAGATKAEAAGGPSVESAVAGAGRNVTAGAIAGNRDSSMSAAVGAPPLGVLHQQRMQGMLSSLCQFVQERGVAFASGVVQPLSPVLALALAEPVAVFPPETQYQSGEHKDQGKEISQAAELSQTARQLKGKAQALKDKTNRAGEKATIEVVSLMFQAILADERLPPALRVWFGRLQVPVLRVALAEPEFFAAPDHPARRLIDRMGACAMGLDNVEVDGSQLEQQVKHIVQLIEQYPETGKKVFQIALEEFENSLDRTLVQSQPVQKFATLAQQIEQKDALTIQYTIELRNMLSAVPVSEDVRQFLFRVWSEVLALAAVRRGAQDAETMRLKQAAVDLLWAVSPKADRAERQQITQHLPGILQTLREGMQTLAMSGDEQDEHIRLINQAAAQAFYSPNQGITPMQMNQLAHTLTSLEEVITDDQGGDLLLDPSLLEQVLGDESEHLQVISSGGMRPDADMLQWTRELQPGQWFTLQYQGAQTRVQYVWRSARGQLHLFATSSAKSYLIQTRRLAAYLQAGLMVPVENETLTIRATHTTLAQLSQKPDLLLH